MYRLAVRYENNVAYNEDYLRGLIINSNISTMEAAYYYLPLSYLFTYYSLC